MQIDTKQEFEKTLRDHRTLKARYGPSMQQRAANGIISMMQECMNPILYEMGPIHATDIATLRRFYQLQHERLRDADDPIAAGQMSANAEILGAIADDYNMQLNYMPQLVDANRLAEMLNNRPIMRPIDYDRILEPAGVADHRQAVVHAAAVKKAPPAVARHAGTDNRTPKPTSKTMLRRTEQAKRPFEEIRADYEATWREIESACQSGKEKIPLITLTDAESSRPWLRVDSDKVNDKIEDARQTAIALLDQYDAEKVCKLLDRVATLHAEHHAAKGAGRGKA